MNGTNLDVVPWSRTKLVEPSVRKQLSVHSFSQIFQTWLRLDDKISKLANAVHNGISSRGCRRKGRHRFRFRRRNRKAERLVTML